MSTVVSLNQVLELANRLSLLDKVRLIEGIAPQIEQDLRTGQPAKPSNRDFWSGIDLHTLAKHQEVRPVDHFDALLGGWPEDESIDDFIAQLRAWRQQNLVKVGSV